MGRMELWGNNGMGAVSPLPPRSEGSSSSASESGNSRPANGGTGEVAQVAVAATATAALPPHEAAAAGTAQRPTMLNAQQQQDQSSNQQISQLDMMKLVATRSMMQQEPSLQPQPLVGSSTTSSINPMPQPPPQSQQQQETQESLRPGAYSGAPGKNLERADTLRYSLVGSPPNEIMEPEHQKSNPAFGTPNDHQNDDDDEEDEDEDEEAITTNDGSLLAVANMVEDTQRPSLLPTATLQLHREKKQCSKILMFLIAGALLGLIAIVVGVMVLVVNNRNDEVSMVTTKSPSQSPSMSPTGALPAMKHLELLYDSLPDKTKENLFDNYTPQSMAWEWLLAHQNITNLPEWRKQQLFALSTFFFSMEGPHWPAHIRQDWLNDTIEECLWINTPLDVLYGFTAIYQKTTAIDVRPCNDNGEIQTIAILNLKLSSTTAPREPFIPPELVLLSSLSNIALAFSNIRASLPALLPIMELQQLTNFQLLMLHANEIYGTIPSQIGMLTDLEYLALGVNNIDGTIATEIGELSALKQLSLVEIPLKGTLPTELGTLSALTDMEIFDNFLTGTIPSELGLLTNLNELAFPQNSLSGPVPSQLGLLTQMIDLDLEYNHLDGSIPTQLGRLSSTMRYLWLNSNHLLGLIPSELGKLSLLQRLFLQNNPAIYGAIPMELWQITGIKLLDLSDLPLLSGTIPDNLCYLQVNNASCLSDTVLGSSYPCTLEFDCSEVLCGCSCPCFNHSNNMI